MNLGGVAKRIHTRLFNQPNPDGKSTGRLLPSGVIVQTALVESTCGDQFGVNPSTHPSRASACSRTLELFYSTRRSLPLPFAFIYDGDVGNPVSNWSTLLLRIEEVRLDFIRTDLGVCSTFADIVETEYTMGNWDHAERTLAVTERATGRPYSDCYLKQEDCGRNTKGVADKAQAPA